MRQRKRRGKIKIRRGIMVKDDAEAERRNDNE